MRNKVLHFILAILLLLFLSPAIYTVINSFRESVYGLDMQHWGVRGYYEVFFSSPDYLVKFWNSLLLSVVIVTGQVVLSCLAGYGFSRFPIPGKNICFYLLIILMMMPYQVTLVSNFIIIDKLHLLDSYLSIILPAIFSPFGVFLMKQSFDACPQEHVDAAMLDGGGSFQILIKIMLPECKPSIITLILLCFIDSWNMVEQPLIFIRNAYRYPLSVFLAQIEENNMAVLCVCSILVSLPTLLLFFYSEDDLMNGIGFSRI